MSRADIGRTNRPRMVNAANNQRPRFVWPRAKYLASLDECDMSEPNATGTLRKTSSISQSVTRCVGQFFPMFPSSQSHPSHSDGSNLATHSCISREYTSGQGYTRALYRADRVELGSLTTDDTGSVNRAASQRVTCGACAEIPAPRAEVFLRGSHSRTARVGRKAHRQFDANPDER